MLLRLLTVTRKKLSGKGATSSVPVQFLSWLLPTLSARGQNLAGSFSTVNFVIKSWNKSHSRQASFVSNYPEALLNQILMFGVNCSIFCCLSSTRKSDGAIFKVAQVHDTHCLSTSSESTTESSPVKIWSFWSF